MAVGKGASSWADITSGYRFSLVTGSAACLATLLINVGVTIWAGTLPDLDNDGRGRRVLFEGSCTTSKNLNLGLHVIINLLSSILLGASNYGIQCLSAPTREQVDEAHAKGSYLDIGIVSVRNLKRQTALTRILWCTLILSSLPLHLLYNSVVFSSLTATRGYMILRSDEIIEQTTDLELPKGLIDEQDAIIRNLVADAGRPGALDNLTTLDCINAYGVSFQTSREDLILVQETGDSKTEMVFDETMLNVNGVTDVETYHWICPSLNATEPCQPMLDTVRQEADDWRPYDDHRVKYCLSRRFPEQLCRVNFNLYLAVGVIVSNVIKMAILAFIALYMAPDRLLVLGDAMQSFMARPDIATRQSCLLSKRHVLESRRDGSPWSGARMLELGSRRWITAVGKARIVLVVILYAISVIVSLTLLIWGITSMNLPSDFGSIWSLGFGQPNEHTLISWNSYNYDYNVAKMATIANVPQIIFSLIYFQWNAVVTGMAMGKEWNSYGTKRAALRVSDRPQGAQRSRYFLELPYKLSIPLIAMSILLHWILSQCIFVVAIEEVNRNGVSKGRITWGSITCGYSPLAIATILLVSLVIPLSIFVLGRRRLRGSVPVAGSCSLAIAAACHHPDGAGHPDAAVEALQWGVMAGWKGEPSQGQEERTQGDQEGQGLLQSEVKYEHCGLSDAAVDEPQPGQMYA